MTAGKKRIVSNINTAPYSNILLLLLIIFITAAAPMMPKIHPVRIYQPTPVSQWRNIPTDTIIVEMDLDHSIKLNNQTMTPEWLEIRLTTVFSRRATRNMYVCAEGGLPYGDIFLLLDIARRSGAQDITLLDKMADSSCAGFFCPNCPEGGGGS